MSSYDNNEDRYAGPGTYTSRASDWIIDTVDTRDGVRTIVKVKFPVTDEEGRRGSPRWTCWLDSLMKDGKPSANLKGLLACGVTMDDVQRFARGETDSIAGLDRNEVNVVCEEDAQGYLQVKWVNDLHGGGAKLEAKRPLDRAQRARVGQSMLAALASLGEAVPKAPAQQTPPGDDDIPF